MLHPNDFLLLINLLSFKLQNILINFEKKVIQREVSFGIGYNNILLLVEPILIEKQKQKIVNSIYALFYRYILHPKNSSSVQYYRTTKI